MKTICLIRDSRPFWPEIEKFLTGANAHVVAFDEEALKAGGLSGMRFDVVIGGRGLPALSKTIPPDVPKVIITEGTTMMSGAKEVHYIGWPIPKETFLDITSRLLHLSERRLFKAVIGVGLKGEKASQMGRSEDFSLTGVAFKVDKELKKGDIVTVSFYLTGLDRRVSLDAEVARTGIDPLDGSTYYGAKFIGLDREEKEMLREFVAKNQKTKK